MTFHSILVDETEESFKKETSEPPAYFSDLNLDQVIDAVTAGREEYNLKPFFYTPLHTMEQIKYRHEIIQDLFHEILLESLKSFSDRMRLMRGHLTQANRLHYKYQKERWFLDTTIAYCDAVNTLAHDLATSTLQSRGFTLFREYLAEYIASDCFKTLQAEAKAIAADLARVKYSLLIKGGCVKVRCYESEADYSVDVERTFEKFKQGTVQDYRTKFSHAPEMNHIEAKILEFVAVLYPSIFFRLDSFCTNHSGFPDKKVANFDREVQFYIACLEHISKFKHAGLKFCLPGIINDSKEVYDYEGFDLALAYKLNHGKTPIVSNDFFLKGSERIFVVSGPNQGGKTTFARTFGQLHYLANIGCPVPGRKANLILFDKMFTHFEKEENLKNLRGKLQDDLIRIYDILNEATPDSIIIMNEIFTSTTLKDALFLGKKVIEKVIELDLLCIFVTFVDELASLSEKNVSMVSTIVPESPASRTFKVVRKPADGLSYALSIAEKYRLTYDCLKERIRS